MTDNYWKPEPLKPCPFCGAPAKFRMKYSEPRRVYYVFAKCSECSAGSGTQISLTNPVDDHWISEPCYYAAQAWNKRVGQPGDQDAEVTKPNG